MTEKSRKVRGFIGKLLNRSRSCVPMIRGSYVDLGCTGNAHYSVRVSVRNSVCQQMQVLTEVSAVRRE